MYIGLNLPGFHTATFNVQDQITHTPIPNVRVDILPPNGSILTPVYGDSNGLISVPLIDGVQMFYLFSQPAYISTTDSENTSADMTKIIYMYPTVVPTTVIPTTPIIDQYTTDTITVKDFTTGTAVSGVTIAYFTTPTYSQYFTSSITDSNGNLTTTVKKSSFYYITISKTGYLTQQTTLATTLNPSYETVYLHLQTGNQTQPQQTSTNPIVNLFIPLANTFGITDIFTISFTVGLLVIIIIAALFMGAIAYLGGGATAAMVALVFGGFTGYVFDVATGIWPLWTVILLVIGCILGGYMIFKKGDNQ